MKIDYAGIFADTPEAPFDPCGAYNALRPAYMEARLSGNPQKISFRDREVWFNKVNIDEWHTVMTDLERQCREKQGLPPKRRAITAGYRTPY